MKVTQRKPAAGKRRTRRTSLSDHNRNNEILADLTRVVGRLCSLGHGGELLTDPSWLVRTITKNVLAQTTTVETDPNLEYGSAGAAEFLDTWSKK